MDLRNLFKTFDPDTARTHVDDWLRRAKRNTATLKTIDHICDSAKSDPFMGCVAWLALTYHAIDKGSQALFQFMAAEANDKFLDIVEARRKFHVPLILHDLNCYSTEVHSTPLWKFRREYMPEYLYKALWPKAIKDIISKLHWVGLQNPGSFVSTVLGNLSGEFVQKLGKARISTPALIQATHRVLRFYYAVIAELFSALTHREMEILAEVLWKLRGANDLQSWHYLNWKRQTSTLPSPKNGRGKMASGKKFPWPGGACRTAEDMERLFGSKGSLYMMEVHNLLEMVRPIVSWEEGVLLSFLLAGSRGGLREFKPEGFGWPDVSRILSKICEQTQRLQSILGIVHGDDPSGIISGEDPESRTCKNLANALARLKRP